MNMFTQLFVVYILGSNVCLYIQDGKTPLHLALVRRHKNIAVMLIEKYGANPTAEKKVRVRSDDE